MVLIDAPTPRLVANNQNGLGVFPFGGTEGVLGVHILHTGGDGTTSIDYEFRLYGDAQA